MTAIERTNVAIGWLAGWLIVPMTVAVAWEVTARFAFNAPTKWAYTVTFMLYGAQFMLAGPHTLMQGGHIRTDMFYDKWSPATRARVDMVCYLLVFFPSLACILYAGVAETWHTWEIGERIGGWRAWPFRGIVPLTAALLMLQGVAETAKCARVLRGGRA